MPILKHSSRLRLNGWLVGAAACALASATSAQTVPAVEFLDRGAVAVTADSGVLVSWRALADDPSGLGFNIYRNGQKLNAAPVKTSSNFLDAQGVAGASYEVRAIRNGKEDAGHKALNISDYLNIPLNKPAGGTTPGGETYEYTANDASVGDLDGDGRYEIILKWDPTNAKDNAFGGYTGPTLLDAYTLEGKQLWRINLGTNIRSGAHYTQFMVADFDGDGKAEIAVKTADGTIDGQGKVIGDPNANWVSPAGEIEQNDRTGSRRTDDGKLMAQLEGRIVTGPEYLSVFDGLTGAVIDTVDYIPQRHPDTHSPTVDQMKELWGDGYANRSDRYLAGVARLDGEHPSFVFARGYYARSVIAAFDLKDGKIVHRWTFDSRAAPAGYAGQGNHQLSVADVDNDGRDEIIYGSMAIDDNGQPLWTARLGHGDAMHVGDLDPTRPGLERFGVHESMRDSGNRGAVMLDAGTGEILWSTAADKDTGRGVAADIDPRYVGAEAWASNSGKLYNARGRVISDSRPRQMNFAIWWDGDLLREILDGNKIYKWDWQAGESRVILDAKGASSNNGSKANPTLQADLFGDWREEVILRADDSSALRVYSTNIPTQYRITTLMHDPQYRSAVAWQNTAYNQPPHPSFYLGEGMSPPPEPRVRIVKP
ncbi:rhamnogalacturonan lyase [Asticcacaulis tiandongensis]|uniref:rhamnogalacturonan lyase n=1 Tax=Asticcacaulis tiandongensis TaxID=2565365 RepID=UPI00112AC44E|nr:rhamnogalacturonan lyase [Asticcacaulis tiandongensis]